VATLRQVIEALDSYIETADGLGITCIKGYPDFARPDVTPPVAALFYSGSQGQGEPARKRVGASATAVSVTLGVYASNEVELFELAEKLQHLRAARPQVVAGSGGSAQKVRLYALDDERVPPDEEAPKEARHVITCPVVISYE